jgi:hypothetical protein
MAMELFIEVRHTVLRALNEAAGPIGTLRNRNFVPDDSYALKDNNRRECPPYAYKLYKVGCGNYHSYYNFHKLLPLKRKRQGDGSFPGKG